MALGQIYSPVRRMREHGISMVFLARLTVKGGYGAGKVHTKSAAQWQRM